jgi:hypothetical protein
MQYVQYNPGPQRSNEVKFTLFYIMINAALPTSVRKENSALWQRGLFESKKGDSKPHGMKNANLTRVNCVVARVKAA